MIEPKLASGWLVAMLLATALLASNSGLGPALMVQVSRYPETSEQEADTIQTSPGNIHL